MQLTPLPLDGLFLAESNLIEDDRGWFMRVYCDQDLGPALNGDKVVQMNMSQNKTKGTVRGLHYQTPPYTETKIIRCIKGHVWDVAVDLRAGSKTFMQYHAEELKAGDQKAIIIPAGFAHGFQTLEDNSELLYAHTQHYTPEADTGLNAQDQRLNISWPLPISVISDKDKAYAPLGDNFTGITL